MKTKSWANAAKAVCAVGALLMTGAAVAQTSQPAPPKGRTAPPPGVPDTERFIFRIVAEMEQWLLPAKPCRGYLAGVMNRLSFPFHCASAHARWLAELAAALDQASLVALELSGQRAACAETIALHQHILALRCEIGSLQT